MAPPPTHAANWMWNNKDDLKDLVIGTQLWLPGSHDAGMCKSEWNLRSDKAGEANVVTQVLDIYDQLCHGIRWFDIRPSLRPENKWYCGHFDNSVGWQGGCGQSIDEVIANVNKFTKDHKELIVLRITHVQYTYKPGGVTQDQQVDIMQRLIDGINDVYQYTGVVKDDKDGTYEDCKSKTLGSYIDAERTGKSCVILSTRNSDGPGIDDSVWYRIKPKSRAANQQCYRTDWDIAPSGVTQQQDWFKALITSDAWFSIKILLVGAPIAFLAKYLWGESPEKDPDSILSIAKKAQAVLMPLAPQRLVANSYKSGGVFDLDDIRSDIGMNMGLATSLMQKRLSDTAATSQLPNLIVVYGGKKIVNAKVLDNIQQAIDLHKKYKVDNASMGGENPWPQVLKSCVVYFATKSHHSNDSDTFVLGRWAFENGSLDFSTDVTQIWSNGPKAKHMPGESFRKAYFALFGSLTLETDLLINMESLGIRNEDDTDPGKRKQWVIRFYKGSEEWDKHAEEWNKSVADRGPYAEGQRQLFKQGSVHKERVMYEHTRVDFGVDVAWAYYGNITVSRVEVYNEIFTMLDDIKGGKIRVLTGFMLANPDGSGSTPPDPDYGHKKYANVRFKAWANDPWRDCWGNEHEDWPIPTTKSLRSSGGAFIHGPYG